MRRTGNLKPVRVVRAAGRKPGNTAGPVSGCDGQEPIQGKVREEPEWCPDDREEPDPTRCHRLAFAVPLPSGGAGSDCDADRLFVPSAGPDENFISSSSRVPRRAPCVLVEGVASQHPGLWRDEPRPVRKRGNEAEVLANVLLADQTDWNSTGVGIHDGRAEQGFEHENALGVMPQRAVPGIGEDGLRLVEPLVERQVVVDEIGRAHV